MNNLIKTLLVNQGSCCDNLNGSMRHFGESNERILIRKFNKFHEVLLHHN